MQAAIADSQLSGYGAKLKTNGAECEKLVYKAVRGDDDAFLELLPLITPDILFSVRYILRNQMDAEDAAQEIIIRVCSSIRELRDPKKFKAWLNSIIVNETRRFMKEYYMNDPCTDIEEYLNDIEEKKVDRLPHESAEKDERDSIIMSIINTLPENQRLAILFHYYKGLSVTETAGMMGVKQQSVSRSLKLARAKIRNELNDHHSGDTRFAYGFSMVPIGSFIKSAIQAEAKTFAADNVGWIARAVKTAAPLYGRADLAGAGAGASVGHAVVQTAAKVTLAFKPVLITVAAVSASAAVITGAYTYNNNAARRVAETVAVEQQGPDANMVCEIIFTGGSADGEHINPAHAIAQASDSNGELTPQNWWITAAGGEEIVFSGDSGTVDDAFEQMMQSGMDGRYTLNYSMLDSTGGTYRIYRDFTIAS